MVQSDRDLCHGPKLRRRRPAAIGQTRDPGSCVRTVLPATPTSQEREPGRTRPA
jgi:hypothetical protein